MLRSTNNLVILDMRKAKVLNQRHVYLKWGVSQVDFFMTVTCVLGIN
jgi:hypothetical protein